MERTRDLLVDTKQTAILLGGIRTDHPAMETTGRDARTRDPAQAKVPLVPLRNFPKIPKEDSRVFEASCEPSSLIAFRKRLRTDWLEKGIVKPTALLCPAITQAQFELKTSPDVTTALAVLEMAASGEDGPFEVDENGEIRRETINWEGLATLLEKLVPLILLLIKATGD